MDGAPTTKAERVRREKEGLHGYETTPVYPSIPLSSGIAPSPVSGLVHEDDVPRDEPSIPSSSGRAPSPVSGLVHEDGPGDEAASGLVDEDGPSSSGIRRGLRYPTWWTGFPYIIPPGYEVDRWVDEEGRVFNALPRILDFLSSGERFVLLEVSIASWQEVSICLKILRTAARYPSITAEDIVTREWTDIVRNSRPHVVPGQHWPVSLLKCRPSTWSWCYHE
jgi:hypothetical protein